MIALEPYDAARDRVCAALRFDPASPAKLVPGYKYDAQWTGAAKDGPVRKVWHWPVASLPVVLRVFPDAAAADADLAKQVVLAGHVNAARTKTIERARALATTLARDVAPARPDGKAMRDYQLAAFFRTLELGGGTRGLFHETGTGKTVTTRELVAALTRPEPGLRKTVIVCPVTLIESAWLIDLQGGFPDLPLVNLKDHRDGARREAAFKAAVERHGHAVALINYETMKGDAAVRRIMTGAYVVFDEVSKCKDYKSATSEACREVGPQFRGCVLLSGTPAPNGEEEYWPLAKIIAPAAGYDPFPGGRSTFTKEFCDERRYHKRSDKCKACEKPKWAHERGEDGACAQFVGSGHHAGFDVKDGVAARIHERLAPICEWLKKDECLSLPPKLFERVPIKLEPATARAYEEMDTLLTTTILAKHGSREELKAHAVNVLSQKMKLRQITAGFVPAFPKEWAEGGGGDKVFAELGREKIDWLLEKAEAGDKIVLWTQFLFEAARYERELMKKKIACKVITGEVALKDRPAIFRGFVSGAFQVLVAHPGVAQWGVSFPGVSQAGYGSLSYSLQEFAQSQDRIHGIGRGDETKRSTFYLLCARAGGQRTIDDDCVDILEGKKTALDFVFELDRRRREDGFVSQDVGRRIDA